jgi:hypothetical protein
MTWQFTDGVNPTININPSTAVEVIWRLKQMLKAMGGIVAGSGDGLSAYSLGTYPYTSHADVFTAGTPYGTGANAMNNSQAWFVLKLPSGRMLAYQRGSGGSTYWRIVYLPLTTDLSPVPQTLAAGSSTVMALPSGGSAAVNYIKGTAASGTGTTYFGGDGTYRMNMAYDDSTYAFYVACWLAGTALTETANGAFFYDPLVAGSYPSEDVDPVMLYCPDYSGAASNAPWRTVTLSAEGTNYCPRAYLRRGMTGEGFVIVSAMMYANSSGTAIVPLGAGSNPHNFKEDGLPVVYARRAGAGIPGGYKGVSSFIRWLAASRGTGIAMNLSTSKDRIVVGDVSLPWDGSTVPLV